uniref:(northern house mosquito) hypothetical protein n=1 Tax=Culex pipiens TaxID=7175 RepID=A0A8D8H6H7_CULPI
MGKIGRGIWRIIGCGGICWGRWVMGPKERIGGIGIRTWRTGSASSFLGSFPVSQKMAMRSPVTFCCLGSVLKAIPNGRRMVLSGESTISSERRRSTTQFILDFWFSRSIAWASSVRSRSSGSLMWTRLALFMSALSSLSLSSSSSSS